MASFRRGGSASNCDRARDASSGIESEEAKGRVRRPVRLWVRLGVGLKRVFHHRVTSYGPVRFEKRPAWKWLCFAPESHDEHGMAFVAMAARTPLLDHLEGSGKGGEQRSRLGEQGSFLGRGLGEEQPGCQRKNESGAKEGCDGRQRNSSAGDTSRPFIIGESRKFSHRIRKKSEPPGIATALGGVFEAGMPLS